MPKKFRQWSDLASQQEATTNALRSYANILDSRLGDIPRDIQVIAQHIHTHLFESGLSVAKIAAGCTVSNHNVTTRFRQATGKGIWEYVVSQRLEAAASVLSTLDVNIYLLAGCVGYTEEAFSKAFRKAYGCSPMEFHRRETERNIEKR